ncbi:interferon-induced protein 44-like isoform X3 [Genypterus blacodes]|uniref:interferon-induced protein 44-like isoform X3 n=1 Tax=Genypterus blacodes TaxID=154954 RepID=UPI003F7638EA
MGGDVLSTPWREMPSNKTSDLEYLTDYKPQNSECQHLRVLLCGPLGGGKSTFINSVDSVLKGRITGRCPVDTTARDTFTKTYKTYRFHKGSPRAFYSFVFNDTMGIGSDANSGICVEDIKLAMMGHVRDGYEEAIEKMREVRLAARDLGIPQLAIVTKVDWEDAMRHENIKNVYKSKSLKNQIEDVSAILGLSVNSIFLVKNYESEVSVNDDVDALILGALRQMISCGEDFLDDL